MFRGHCSALPIHLIRCGAACSSLYSLQESGNTTRQYVKNVN